MRLIPDYIESDAPPGETQVFAKLQNASRNWVAIHSLDLAPYNRNRRTEIDFLIVMPDSGIFCIEVKSQKNIYFDGERWQPESIRKSPFKQAMDARYAFRRRLTDSLSGKFRRIPVIHCCIFVESDFQVGNSISIKQYELIDRREFHSCKSADDFCRILEMKFIRSVEGDPEVNSMKGSLAEDEIKELIEFCYPIRIRRPERQDEIARRQIELEASLLLQQRPAMTLVDLNDRVLVTGGAGTGKTLIGLEVAKRKAETGLRVAFLCFNRLVGLWLEKSLEENNYPNLVSGSVYKILLGLADIEIPDEANWQWWEQDAPELIEERLTEPDLATVSEFDYVVLDEAQDILARPALWGCIQIIIKGGLSRGNFLILGDFTNQVMTYNIDMVCRNLSEIKNNTTNWALEENCRNYKYIGDAAVLLAGLDKNAWKGYLRRGGVPDDWKIVTYEDNVDQVLKLRESILDMKSDGFSDTDIVLLSFCALDKSVFGQLVKNGMKVVKWPQLESDYIRYSTVSAFKGMENKVVIITDIVLSPQNRDMERRLFYTGITRATEKVILMCKKSAAEILLNWVAKRI